jgi:hypothetical protein
MKSYEPSLKRGNVECPTRCTYTASGPAFEEYPEVVAAFDALTGKVTINASRRRVSHQSHLSMSVTCESSASTRSDRSVSFDYTIVMVDDCYDAVIGSPSTTSWQTSSTAFLWQKDQSTKLTDGWFTLDKPECGPLVYTLPGLDESVHKIVNTEEKGITLYSNPTSKIGVS